MTHKEETFMEVAQVIAELGTCDRARVGAVIIMDGRCVSWGYNGAPPGLPHCSENNHGWGDSGLTAEAQGCRNATHAEANAIAFAARQGISTESTALYVTVAPCEVCARLIIASGISYVYALHRYRDDSGAQLLVDAGVPIHFLEDE